MITSSKIIRLRRLWWVGPLTVTAAIVAVLAVRAGAGVVLTVSPDFKPFLWGAVIVFTAVLVTVAVLVFAVVARFAGNPVRTYRRMVGDGADAHETYPVAYGRGLRLITRSGVRPLREVSAPAQRPEASRRL